jgi:hypothetical protein
LMFHGNIKKLPARSQLQKFVQIAGIERISKTQIGPLEGPTQQQN